MVLVDDFSKCFGLEMFDEFLLGFCKKTREPTRADKYALTGLD